MCSRSEVKKKKISFPKRALTNYDIERYGVNILNFRGVFMRNNLPKKRPDNNECAIINLDDYNSSGTHWTGYRKVLNKVFWFDPFGDLPPPLEILNHFRGYQIFYNYDKFQTYGSVYCGQWCLKYLMGIIKPKIWKNVENNYHNGKLF